MNVRDVFHSDAVVLDAALTVGEAYAAIQSQEFTTFPIVDSEDRCIGTVTEMRLRRNIAAGNSTKPLTDIRSRRSHVVRTATRSHGSRRMNAVSVRQLSVVSRDTKRFLGIITMSDIVRAQANALAPSDEPVT